MAAFAGETMNQTTRLFMSQISSFTSAVAQHRPALRLKFARHLFEKMRAECLRSRLSLALKLRLPFFQKRLHAFIFVFAGKGEREEIDFAAQAFVKIRTRGELDSFLRQAQCDRAFLSNAICDLHR